jgi:hypothetical protein
MENIMSEFQARVVASIPEPIPVELAYAKHLKGKNCVYMFLRQEILLQVEPRFIVRYPAGDQVLVPVADTSALIAAGAMMTRFEGEDEPAPVQTAKAPKITVRFNGGPSTRF